MKFNIEDYDHSCVMHCKTQEEAKEFCRFLDSVGCVWLSGEAYTDHTGWQPHSGGTCYRFHQGTRAQLDYYLDAIPWDKPTLVLEFDHFVWDDVGAQPTTASMSFEELMGL